MLRNPIALYSVPGSGTETSCPRIASALSLEELLQAITDQARTIIGAHMSVTGFTVDEYYVQAIDMVSLSDKFAWWPAQSEPFLAEPKLGPDGGG